MEKKTIKKLQLNKETIARLDNMNEIRGGDLTQTILLCQTADSDCACLVSNACNTGGGTPTCGTCGVCGYSNNCPIIG